MKFNIGKFEIQLKRKIYRKRWLLNFVPMIGAIDVCEDKKPYNVIGRHYDFCWLTILMYFYIPVANRSFKKVFHFPPDKVIDLIESFHKD